MDGWRAFVHAFCGGRQTPFTRAGHKHRGSALPFTHLLPFSDAPLPPVVLHLLAWLIGLTHLGSNLHMSPCEAPAVPRRCGFTGTLQPLLPLPSTNALACIWQQRAARTTIRRATLYLLVAAFSRTQHHAVLPPLAPALYLRGHRHFCTAAAAGATCLFSWTKNALPTWIRRRQASSGQIAADQHCEKKRFSWRAGALSTPRNENIF